MRKDSVHGNSRSGTRGCDAWWLTCGNEEVNYRRCSVPVNNGQSACWSVVAHVVVGSMKLCMRRSRVPVNGTVVSGGQYAACTSIEIDSRRMCAIGVGFLLCCVLLWSVRKDEDSRATVIEDLSTVSARSPVVGGDEDGHSAQSIAKIRVLEKLLPRRSFNVSRKEKIAHGGFEKCHKTEIVGIAKIFGIGAAEGLEVYVRKAWRVGDFASVALVH